MMRRKKNPAVTWIASLMALAFVGSKMAACTQGAYIAPKHMPIQAHKRT